MEFNKSIFALIFSSLLLFSVDAHRIAFGPSSNSPSPSPSTIIYHPPRFACKTLYFPAFNPFNPPKIINPALSNICGHTENPTKCVALISPCITGSVNSFSALEAIIVSLIEHVENTLSFALKLSKSKSTSSEVLKALNLCIELYVKIIDDLKNALDALKAHDSITVKTMLTATITNVGHCDDAFHQLGLTQNWPLKKIDHLLTQLAGFGLDIHGKLIINVHD